MDQLLQHVGSLEFRRMPPEAIWRSDRRPPGIQPGRSDRRPHRVFRRRVGLGRHPGRIAMPAQAKALTIGACEVRAVIVGIESYQTTAVTSLRGVADEAVAYARALTGLRVPAANIQ